MGHGAWNRDGERGWAVSHTGSRYRNKVCALFSKDGTDGNSISLYVSVAPDNEWHHIAVTRSGSIFMMSADGQTGTSVTYDGALYDSSEVLKIGSSDNWNAAEGYLDQIRIIRGKALTQDEIEDYIQNGQ
ncbi:MAG: LamG domain-containing protein [Herbaspirillum sp.]|nr:LamG domain-containing protein [Herbaspirillum sp.]